MPTKHKGSAAEVRALDAYIKLMRASDAVTHRLAPYLTAQGLTFSQFGVLEALLHLGSMCQKDLGAKLLKSGGNITLVVDNLEKRRLVRREPLPSDRRYVVVSLTADGEALIRRIFPEHAVRITGEMSVLDPDEQETLGQLLRKVGIGEIAISQDEPNHDARNLDRRSAAKPE
jgi:MarR family transcriptional regulator, 2-MHQ and catechol-resistance regulon repressor